MARGLGALVATALLVGAGCLGAPGGPGAAGGDESRQEPGNSQDGRFLAEWAERALSSDSAHRHDDYESHFGLSTPNFNVIGHEPLVTDYHGRTSGGYGCSASAEHENRRLSITASFTTDMALVISDVTDPAEPRKIGELALGNTHVYDDTLTPDLRFALLATSPYESGPEINGTQTRTTVGSSGWFFRDACTGQEQPLLGPEQSVPFASGLLLVNVENPRNPFVEDFRPLPIQGAHCVRAHEVDDRPVLLASVSARSAAVAYYAFLEVVSTPAGNRIAPLSVFYPPEHVTYRPIDGAVHNGWIQVHPITGERLAYLADVYQGAWIVNIDDLRDPKLLAHWDPKTYHARDMIVHGIQPIDGTWDGRQYAWVHEENYGRPADTPTGWLTLLDTTDPANPKTVSAWTFPTDFGWTATFQFSLHYTGILNRTVFVASHHGGLWAIDASTPSSLTDLRTVGVFLPDLDTPEPAGPPSNAVTAQLLGDLINNRPLVVDLDVLADGTIITYDARTGLYALRFDATNPAPKPDPRGYESSSP